MWKLIEKLQRKPEGERKRILFGTTIAISLVIFIVWLVIFQRLVLSQKFSTPPAVDKNDDPLETLKESFSTAYDSFKSQSTTSSSTIITASSSPTSSPNSAGQETP